MANLKIDSVGQDQGLKKARLSAGLLNPFSSDLTAATRTPTAHTPVAAPVPGHDRAADVAAGGVAQVNVFFQRIGGVVEPAVSNVRVLRRGRLRSMRLQTASRRRGFISSRGLCPPVVDDRIIALAEC